MRLLVWPMLALLFLSCSEGNRTAPGPAPPSQVVEGFRMTETDAGQKLYELVAQRALVFGPEKKTQVDQPRITFFDDQGRVSSLLRARAGTIYRASSDLVAQESVEVRTSDSTYLWCDSLRWNNETHLVTTDCWVKIKSPQGEFTGKGLVSDAQLEKIEIREKIQGTSPYQFQR